MPQRAIDTRQRTNRVRTRRSALARPRPALAYVSLLNLAQNLEPVPLLCRHPQPLSPFRHALSKRNFLSWTKELVMLRLHVKTVLDRPFIRE